MDEPIITTLPFRLEPTECVSAIRYGVLRFYPFWSWLAAGLACVAIGAALPARPFLVGGAALVVIALYSLVLMPELRGRKLARVAEERTMTFSDQGVRIKTATQEAHPDWDRYRRIYQLDDLLLLRTAGRSTVVIIPRRAFAASVDATAMIGLAERHVEKRTEK